MWHYSLLSLLSPLLPIGGFTWSQGLEKAVEDELIVDAKTLEEWVRYTVERGLVFSELPLLIRLYKSLESKELATFDNYVALNKAVRATFELRLEEYEKGRALVSILPSLGVDTKCIITKDKFNNNIGYLPILAQAALFLGIPLHDILRGFIFSYVENAILVGAKTIPLGQSAAWQLITSILQQTAHCLEDAFVIDDDEIGAGAFSFALESARHETMYSRIYRN